ncbi:MULTISPECIES: ABC transporter permease [Cellulosimicrobium]|uniref:ABC transporter permease n=1 Tax=Cellulosimicrobium sp. ES-005 TaxID=3163031 RepID=A0AAU8G0P7_9MICO|nr:ABC transporter permease [Cellulosimicrobium cellulans]MCO7272809.1 ABC transporter permease [Cellulosimicrobium cellulans]
MFSFISRRVLAGLATLLVSTFAMFLLVSAAIRPYIFMDLEGSTNPNKAQLIEQRTIDLDLHTNVVIRYFKWLGDFVQGDLGVAWRSGQQVTALLQGAVISTIQLVAAATVLAVVFGVMVGIVSALRQYSTFDYLTIFVSFVLYSLPAFWVAVLLKQWGAIGFNDFLRDPNLSILAIAVVGVIIGLLWSLAFGGTARRRATVFGMGFAASALALLYLQLSGWWAEPNLGPVIIVVTGTALAFAITALVSGLQNRRALYAALTTVVVGVVVYFPIQSVLRQVDNWWLVLVLAVVTVAVGIGIGFAWGGPDKGVSARAAAITAFLVGSMIFVDKVMSVWPAYFAAPAINGRPIPTIGNSTPNLGGNFWVQVLDQYTHLLLPTIALVLIQFAGYTRYSRASMLEVMSQDYIRTARAKGLPERTVVMRHGFRNTLIPLATIVPIDVITLLGGAIITEKVFGRPGMGLLFLNSLQRGEIDPVMAYLVIVAALAIIANIVADLIYAALDPRIRVNA